MTTLLNLQELLAPISTEAPAGQDLRNDESPNAAYYLLKEARNNARAIERNSFPGQENPDHPEKEYWKVLLKQAPEVLATQSKDLEIAAWYTEALIREHGFVGLKEGLQLITGLVSDYWDALYPAADEDGLSSKIAPIVGLNGLNNSNGTLIVPINTAPLTADGLYSSWSYSQALELGKITDATAKKKKMEAGAVSLDTLKAAVKPSTTSFYTGLEADLITILADLESLDTLLTERCGDEAPSTGQIRKAVETALNALRIIAKNVLMVEEDHSNDESALESDSSQEEAFSEDTSGTNLKLNGNIKGRLEAFKNLENIAEFFKRTEPHSPIGYTLERILRWGDMTLPELLQELIPDAQAKDYYQKLVGINPPAAMQPNSTMMPPENYGGMDPMAQNQYNPDPYQNNRGMFDNGSGPPNGGFDDSLYR